MAVWSSLVARLAHNQEVVGSNPTIRNHSKGAPSNLFLMKKFLAQLVEQLSAKQYVVGSSPTKSFQPRLVYAWVAYLRSKHRSEKPECGGSTPLPGTIKTENRGSALTLISLCCLPLYDKQVRLSVCTFSIYFQNVQKQKLLCQEEFLHLGCEVCFLPLGFTYIFWRSTQVGEGAGLLNLQVIARWRESSSLSSSAIIFYTPAGPGVPYKELRVAKNREQIAEGCKRYFYMGL